MPRLSSLVALVVLVVLVSSLSGGCAYLKNRGNDAADMFDIGLTFTKTPQVAVYGGFQSLLGVGYSNIDGYMAGLGGRNFGWLDMRYHAAGAVLEGYEQFGYDGGYDAAAADSPRRRGVGLGMLYEETPRTVPEMLQCPKYVHFLFIGVNVNCKLGEIFDFILGWTTLDIGKDDTF